MILWHRACDRNPDSGASTGCFYKHGAFIYRHTFHSHQIIAIIIIAARDPEQCADWILKGKVESKGPKIICGSKPAGQERP